MDTGTVKSDTSACADYSPDTTLLVFPGSHSRTLQQILEEEGETGVAGAGGLERAQGG